MTHNPLAAGAAKPTHSAGIPDSKAPALNPEYGGKANGVTNTSIANGAPVSQAAAPAGPSGGNSSSKREKAQPLPSPGISLGGGDDNPMRSANPMQVSCTSFFSSSSSPFPLFFFALLHRYNACALSPLSHTTDTHHAHRQAQPLRLIVQRCTSEARPVRVPQIPLSEKDAERVPRRHDRRARRVSQSRLPRRLRH